MPSDTEIREYLTESYEQWLADGTYANVIGPAIDLGNTPILGLDHREARDKDITYYKITEFIRTNGSESCDRDLEQYEEDFEWQNSNYKEKELFGDPTDGDSKVTATLWFLEPDLPSGILYQNHPKRIKTTTPSVDIPNQTDGINAWYDMREDDQPLNGSWMWSKTEFCQVNLPIKGHRECDDTVLYCLPCAGVNSCGGIGPHVGAVGYGDYISGERFVIRGKNFSRTKTDEFVLNWLAMNKIHGAKITVIGGGTGSFVVLSGLKNYTSHLTALVSMADDGGSTGQLRDELGVLPPGDVRQCLVALSHSPHLRDLFNYRFDEGSLEGHSFGNLFLTALEKMRGSFVEAIDLASKVLNVEGRVIPVTLDSVTVCLDDREKILCHERDIREATFRPRPKLWLEPEPEVNPIALDAIREADLIVIAPGGLYESLGSVLAVSGIGAALNRSSAKKIYVCNLMNQKGHTDDFGVTDYADELERLAGTDFLDYVIYNVHQPSKKLLKKYADEGELPVNVRAAALRAAHYKTKGAELLASEIWQNPNKKDKIASQRALIRHDPDAVARAIMKIYFS